MLGIHSKGNSIDTIKAWVCLYALLGLYASKVLWLAWLPTRLLDWRKIWRLTGTTTNLWLICPASRTPDLQIRYRVRYLVSNKSFIAGYGGWDPQENYNYVCGRSRRMLSGHHPHVSISLQTLQRKLLGLVDLNSFWLEAKYILLSSRGWKAASVQHCPSTGRELPQYSGGITTIDCPSVDGEKTIIESRFYSSCKRLIDLAAGKVSFWATCAPRPLHLPGAVSRAGVKLHHQEPIHWQQDDCQL